MLLTLFDHLLGGYFRLVLLHDQNDLGQLGNRPALDDLRKIAFQILFFIYIGTKTDRFRHETGSTVPLFLGGLPAIFPHIEVLDGFRSVGEYLVIAAVYGNRYIRHKVYMNRLSMKSKQFVNGYQRI